MAAAVTESLPNLKMSGLPKRADTIERCIHAAFKAVERRKPCVVMKRAESIYPVQLRSATEECREWVKHRFVA